MLVELSEVTIRPDEGSSPRSVRTSDDLSYRESGYEAVTSSFGGEPEPVGWGIRHWQQLMVHGDINKRERHYRPVALS